METIANAVGHLPRFSTVLIACHSDGYGHDLIAKMEERELSVLGPVYTSHEALTLAAHTGADFALVEMRLADGDRGHALADQLERTWGIPSLLLQGHE